MKLIRVLCCILLAVALSVGMGSAEVFADEAADAKLAAAKKADKTGTNPINFTFDARLYNEYMWLNTAGDGNQNVTTFEFRMPILKGKWQFRLRTRFTDLKADTNDDGVDNLDETGMGDSDIRFLTVPYLNMAKKKAVAFGLEVFFDTASEDELGSGATSLGPQVFAVYFKPFGGFVDLVAPAYQHKFSIDEDSGRSKVHQGLIDVFFLKMRNNKAGWIMVDPQFVLDYENNIEFMILDLEYGTMLDKLFGTTGHSTYMRPSIGIGSDRPTDGSIEIAYKIIW